MRTIILLLIILLCACSRPIFKTRWTKEQAPDKFVARFESAKGSFDVEMRRDLSPKAVDRVYQLVKHHYYDNGLFYRVVPKFVVQFGNSDSTKQQKWEKIKLPDEKVAYGNKAGTISFARSGKETRSTELFINLEDNPRLDTISYSGVTGFPAIGDVIRGMDVVKSLYGEYGNRVFTRYELMYKNRAAFIDTFPKLDIITKAYLLK